VLHTGPGSCSWQLLPSAHWQLYWTASGIKDSPQQTHLLHRSVSPDTSSTSHTWQDLILCVLTLARLLHQSCLADDLLCSRVGAQQTLHQPMPCLGFSLEHTRLSVCIASLSLILLVVVDCSHCSTFSGCYRARATQSLLHSEQIPLSLLATSRFICVGSALRRNLPRQTLPHHLYLPPKQGEPHSLHLPLGTDSPFIRCCCWNSGSPPDLSVLVMGPHISLGLCLCCLAMRAAIRYANVSSVCSPMWARGTLALPFLVPLAGSKTHGATLLLTAAQALLW